MVHMWPANRARRTQISPDGNHGFSVTPWVLEGLVEVRQLQGIMVQEKAFGGGICRAGSAWDGESFESNDRHESILGVDFATRERCILDPSGVLLSRYCKSWEGALDSHRYDPFLRARREVCRRASGDGLASYLMHDQMAITSPRDLAGLVLVRASLMEARTGGKLDGSSTWLEP